MGNKQKITKTSKRTFCYDLIMNIKKWPVKFWLILGASFILFGFVLAHLSNANLIHWSYGLENAASVIFHGCGPLFLLIGIIKIFTKKLKAI